MGLYLADNPHRCFQTFFWSFFLAWILAITTASSPWWILFLGLAVVFFNKALPNYDFGAANVFGRWIGGMFGTCDNGACIQEFLFTILLQFGGSLVGAMLYNWILDAAPAPTLVGPLNDDGEADDGKVFILFAFANFFQAYALNCAEGGLSTATAYTLSWVLCQVTWAGSIGGVTIDLGRLLGGEITHSDLVVFDKFWQLIVGPLAGWGICFAYQWVESTLAAKEGAEPAKEVEAVEAPAADNNAEEQA